MDNVSYNENRFKKQNTGYSLRKMAVNGLKIIGPVAFLSLLLFTANKKVDSGFEYDPNIITVYDMDERQSYSELSVQYQKFLTSEGVDTTFSKEVSERLNLLGSYVEAKENYEDIASYADNKELTEYRKKLVSNVGILREASLDLLKIKVRESLGLTDAAQITIDYSSNSADGPDYIIRVEYAGDEHTISSLPRDYFAICNLYDRLDYEGDGTNEKAWTKQVTDEYINLADELFHLDLRIAVDSHQFRYDKTSKKF